MNSARSFGASTHFSMIGGFPNFSRHRPRNNPKTIEKPNTPGGHGCASAGYRFFDTVVVGSPKTGFSPRSFGFRSPDFIWSSPHLRSKAEFEQADLEGKCFLYVAVQQAVQLLHLAKILHRLAGR